jgi:hypothetical protein
MEMPKPKKSSLSRLAEFDRNFFESGHQFTYIGSGELGGKAGGLVGIRDVLSKTAPEGAYGPIHVEIPTLTVIATDMFDKFIERNKLLEVVRQTPRDDLLAHAFQKAELPAELVGDLRALANKVHSPLAVRSSSLLEDAMFEPFAGVYSTKMVPNNQFDSDSRFRALVEAVKYVYASTYFRCARDYHRATSRPWTEEKMAVIIQEVVGERHGDRFYPTVSGVARSYNFYPTGHSKPHDGVVSLALGLGKTIVDGGRCWTYSPAFPYANPPYASVGELIDMTQSDFWAVNMGKPPAYDPTKETEYMCKCGLKDAEDDGVMAYLASTYDAGSDKLYSGLGSTGPRMLTFAPLLRLEELPINNLLKALLVACEEEYDSAVELEFAMSVPAMISNRLRLGFLQVRPMFVSDAQVDVREDELHLPRAIVGSERVLGNGVVDTIRDIVYVKPDVFDAAKTREIGHELVQFNQRLLDESRPYLLIVLGRLGTSDPWLGIPVEWGDVSGAKVIVEAATSKMNVDLSQGSHFFHNVTSLQICYFSADGTEKHPIRWEWLEKQTCSSETEHVRHLSLDAPLLVKVDGRSGRGVVIA